MNKITHIMNLCSTFLKVAQGLDLNPENIVSPELAHNDYLIEVIKHFATREVALDSINQFAQDNLQSINELRKFFGKKPTLLGKGEDGIVFDIGNGMVLKFTKDQFSVNKAIESIERLHGQSSLSKTEAMIYDVDSLGINPGSRTPIYYIVMERMIPIQDIENIDPDLYYNISELLRLLRDKLKEIFERDVWSVHGKYRLERGESLMEQLKKEAIKVIKWCNSDPECKKHLLKINQAVINNILNLRSDWLENFVEELFNKACTQRGDLKLGNLGITGYGTLCFYDAAHRYFKDSINVKDFEQEI